MHNTKHYFHNNAYNGVTCWIFHIVQLKFVFSLVLEFTRCFAVKYWWVLHWSYITACFCMLFLVLSYIGRHDMRKSSDGISLNWALRFIFILQILFACALCFIPFYNYRLYFKLVVLTIPRCVITSVHCLCCFPRLGRFRIQV